MATVVAAPPAFVHLERAGSRATVWLIALALAHGLVYAFLVPPWQHYDEPAHFRYAAEVAAAGLTAPPDPAIGRQIVDSMYRHAFYPPDVRPDLVSPTNVSVGENQRVHGPVYYVLVAGPIGLTEALEIETQLYAARLLSVGLYVMTVLVAWRLALTVAPDEPAVQLALPALLLLAPAFADLMSAVNSDVLVNFCAAAMLLGWALLIRDGPRPTGLALALLGLAGALLSKRTVAIALVPCGLVLLWALRRRPLPWWAYAGGFFGLVAVLGLLGLEIATVERGGGGTYPALVARPWLRSLDETYLRLKIDLWLRSVSDLEASAPAYLAALPVAFTSFWARFGWSQIGLGPIADWTIAGLNLAVVVGLLRRWLEVRADEALPLWQWRWVLLCLVSFSCAWLAVLARLHPLPGPTQPFYLPRGRYMFWALLPALWLLALGWQGLMPKRWRPYSLYVLVGLFGLLDGLALTALVRWYYLG